MNKLKFIDWELIPYSEAYEKQQVLFEEAIQLKSEQKETDNFVIFCEHFHVITVGKNGLFSNLLFPPEILQEKKVALFHVNRGGDITYHGPGQLVAYPILDLNVFHIGLKEYIFRLEEIIIRLLSEYGIQGERLAGAPGVWIDTEIPNKTRKIAAVGVKSNRFVTMHGFALNVDTDLSYFDLINPCGFTNKSVTSIEKETGQKPDKEAIKQKLTILFEEVFL
ncbi:octanoyltransferase [Bacteroidia bacterium]|nr:octanoyltransferase [Bacteroidia bacterium]